MKPVDWIDTLNEFDLWLKPEEARTLLAVILNRINPKDLTAYDAQVLNKFLQDLERIGNE